VGLSLICILLSGVLWPGSAIADETPFSGSKYVSELNFELVTNPLPVSLPEGSNSTDHHRIFFVTGVIRGLSPEKQTAVVRHEAIPGFMPRMTMEFDVRDTNQLHGLKVGDTIRFRLLTTETDSWIDGLQRMSTNAPALDADSGASLAEILNGARLKPGATLPDCKLLGEDGRALSLSEFSGKALAFTFLFTRCPLPDFCPRMNDNFNQARMLLQQLPGGPTNWQFLSISFDAEFDRPEVLRRYAQLHRGSSHDRWLFASASAPVMAAMASQLDFRFAEEEGSFVHNLRTVVLDPKRRLYRQFDGNKWQPGELAQALAEAAQIQK